MSSAEKVRDAVKWYSEKRPLYMALATKVEGVLREVLDTNSTNYHTITRRTKELDQYERKAKEEKYKDPQKEIMDMAGIRVITYTQSEANQVAALVKDLFDVMPEHSIDKTEELGIDRVGYRSLHFVATLGEARRKLPENRAFDNMCFEIQVRTILQHAWAEFEHDRNYKFTGVLPPEVKRRVSVLSGSLELIDREFDNIAKAIEEYAADVERKAESGDLAVAIDSTSLMTYLTRRFLPLIDKGLQPTFNRGDLMIIEELRDMKITKLEELDRVIAPNLEKLTSIDPRELGVNFFGLVRFIMILHSPEMYFATAWKRHWIGMDAVSSRTLKKLGINIDLLSSKFGFHVIDLESKNQTTA